jgi:hypothetical protein
VSIDRNAILDALAARIRDGVPSLHVERRMRSPAPEEMPLLVVAGTTEQTNESDDSMPARWVISAGCFLWVHDPGDQGPAREVQDLVGRIEDALQNQPGECNSAWTSLGGLVWEVALVGVDSLVDAEALDVGLALLRISIRCKPSR